MPGRVADPAPEREALGHVALGRVEVAAAVGVGPEPVEDDRLGLLVAVLAATPRAPRAGRTRRARSRPGTRPAAPRRRAPCGGRAPGRRAPRASADGEPQPALGVVAAGPPELGERPGQPDRERAVALLRRPVEGLADVVVGLVEPVERLDLARRSAGPDLRGLDHRRAPRTRAPSASRRARRTRRSRSSASARTVVSIAYAVVAAARAQQRRGGELAQALADVDARPARARAARRARGSTPRSTARTAPAITPTRR